MERFPVRLKTILQMRANVRALVADPQPDAAMKSVADRLGSRGAVEKYVGDPAIGDTEADAGAILEPALVAECRHHGAVAGHGGDDAGVAGERLHEAAIDVGFDAAAEQ